MRSKKNARRPIMIAVGMDRAIKLGEEVLVFNPTVKKGEKRKFTIFF